MQDLEQERRRKVERPLSSGTILRMLRTFGRLRSPGALALPLFSLDRVEVDGFDYAVRSYRLPRPTAAVDRPRAPLWGGAGRGADDWGCGNTGDDR